MGQEFFDISSLLCKEAVKEMQSDNPFIKLNDVVFTILENAILKTALTPGSRLSITKLADTLGVSPTPVREALDKLAEIGLVVIPRRRDQNYNAYYVIDPDEKTLEGLFTARIAVEPSAAFICADRNWSIDLERLLSLTVGFEQELRRGNFHELNRATEFDLAFHREIIQATNNETLQSMYSSFSKKLAYLSLRTKDYLANEDIDSLYRLGRQHRSIYNAIQLGFPQLAAELMVEHIRYCEAACIKRKTNHLSSLQFSAGSG